MTVETKKVEGRRTVHYDTFDDLLADAERLGSCEVKTLGNWSLGQIQKHLATAFECSIDGFPSNLPAPVRLIFRLAMKKRFLTRPLPAGFQLPKKAGALIPGETTAADGLSKLRGAIERLGAESNREPNPALGPLTIVEWNELHLRHAEMHMSFVVPVSD